MIHVFFSLKKGKSTRRKRVHLLQGFSPLVEGGSHFVDTNFPYSVFFSFLCMVRCGVCLVSFFVKISSGDLLIDFETGLYIFSIMERRMVQRLKAGDVLIEALAATACASLY